MRTTERLVASNHCAKWARAGSLLCLAASASCMVIDSQFLPDNPPVGIPPEGLPECGEAARVPIFYGRFWPVDTEDDHISTLSGDVIATDEGDVYGACPGERTGGELVLGTREGAHPESMMTLTIDDGIRCGVAVLYADGLPLRIGVGDHVELSAEQPRAFNAAPFEVMVLANGELAAYLAQNVVTDRLTDVSDLGVERGAPFCWTPFSMPGGGILIEHNLRATLGEQAIEVAPGDSGSLSGYTFINQFQTLYDGEISFRDGSPNREGLGIVRQ